VACGLQCGSDSDLAYLLVVAEDAWDALFSPFFWVFNWMVSVEKEYAMGAEGALAD